MNNLIPLIKQYNVLFSKSYNGALNIWYAYINNHNQIVRTYGKLLSNLVTKTQLQNPYITYTPHQILDKLTKDKRNSGYKSIDELNIDINKISTDNELISLLNTYLNPDKFDISNTLKPMKAKKFELDLMTYPAFAQPKINGVRCRVAVVSKDEGLFGTYWNISLMSREGIEYNVPNIEKEFKELYNQISGTTLEVFIDGEIYIKDTHVTNIAGAAKNIKNELNSSLCFIIFDIAIPNVPQYERIEMLETFKDIIKSNNFNYISVLETVVVQGDDEFISHTNLWIDEGFEGGILRDYNAPYYFGGRRNNMLKLKRSKSSIFTIVDIVPISTDNTIGIFVCKNDIDDNVFNCNPMGTMQERRELLINKNNFIGKRATVKFYERTSTGLPFHANLINIL